MDLEEFILWKRRTPFCTNPSIQSLSSAIPNNLTWSMSCVSSIVDSWVDSRAPLA